MQTGGRQPHNSRRRHPAFAGQPHQRPGLAAARRRQPAAARQAAALHGALPWRAGAAVRRRSHRIRRQVLLQSRLTALARRCDCCRSEGVNAPCVGARDIDLCKRPPTYECRWSAELGSLMGMDGDTPTSSGGSPHAVAQPVFPLPPEYEEAKERRVASVVELRNAVKTVRVSSVGKCRSGKAMNIRGECANVCRVAHALLELDACSILSVFCSILSVFCHESCSIRHQLAM
jgi:hypothetical protein